MTEIAIHRRDAQRMGFFTDTTTCIGCKACEVACKQWNDLPADGCGVPQGRLATTTPARSAQRRGGTCASSRPRRPHRPTSPPRAGCAGAVVGRRRLQSRRRRRRRAVDGGLAELGSWVFMSDVCKHCTNAGCLDACPTGALIRTEFETVVLQADVCNGCGYCIPSCPFGVVDRDPYDGRAAKCTLCYDRLEDGLEPACAKACPTDSIQFGPYDELVDDGQGARRRAARERGRERLPLRRGRRHRARAARRRAGRVLPADRAARALRAARAGGLPDPGERRRSRTSPGSRPRSSPRRRRSRDALAHRRAAGEPPPRRHPPEEAILREQRGRIDGRDVTPALGTRGRPGPYRRAVEGAKVALAKPRWGDARWSYLFGPDTRYRSTGADDDAEAAARAVRGPDDPTSTSRGR